MMKFCLLFLAAADGFRLCLNGASELSPTADAPDSPSDASRPPIASKAADECAVCLEALGPQRLLFENCGHARLCESCSLDVEHCPLCMARVGDRCMRIWV